MPEFTLINLLLTTWVLAAGIALLTLIIRVVIDRFLPGGYLTQKQARWTILLVFLGPIIILLGFLFGIGMLLKLLFAKEQPENTAYRY